MKRTDPKADAERHIVYLRSCIDAGLPVVTYHLMVQAYIHGDCSARGVKEGISESLADPDADAAWKLGL